jgi:hypothetical protein
MSDVLLTVLCVLAQTHEAQKFINHPRKFANA